MQNASEYRDHHSRLTIRCCRVVFVAYRLGTSQVVRGGVNMAASGPADVETQKREITELMKKTLVKGDIW